MNDALKNLLDQLKGTGGGSKIVAGLVGVAMMIAIGLTAVVSNRPHYDLTFQGLAGHDATNVSKALAEAGIDFYVSQPPGPYSVFVDEGDRSRAFAAAYGSGALDKPLKGIIADGGMSSVFLGAEERRQGVQKREWGEMEGMLETLDFVVSARVRTSVPNTSPLASRRAPEPTASVTLQLYNGTRLTPEQMNTVAQLVENGLGVKPDNLMISDQAGNSLFDGEVEGGSATSPRDLLAVQTSYDEAVTKRVNGLLEATLGPGKARVTVTSEWDFDVSTTRTESASGKGGLLSEYKTSTETPLADAVGGPAGASSNLADPSFGTEASPTGEDFGTEPAVATSTQERKEYDPTTTTVETVRTVPVLERVSVAAFFDASLDAASIESLEGTIRAAVGLDDTRGDTLVHSIIPFHQEEVLESDEVADGAEETSGQPSPMMEMLMRRGVEIATALVFIGLLLKSLKSSKTTAARAQKQAVAQATQDENIDPELLARAKVDELLRADPDRVADILSDWARSDEPVAGAKS